MNTVDLITLFLESSKDRFINKLNIRNYKISTTEHIWNAVYMNDSWFHIDLTWDDPVTDTGEPMLLDEFFLINQDELVNKKTGQHNFEELVYKEIATKVIIII